MEIPERLYKYRGISQPVLECLITDRLYFSDPYQFNDPLEISLRLEIDLNVAELKDIVKKLVEERTRKEKSAALWPAPLKVVQFD